MGHRKTEARLTKWCFWSGLYDQVERFCQACPACQRVNVSKPAQAPLQLMPMIKVPFSRIALDMVWPLPKISAGHQYLLVIIDYATRFPEAVPMHTVTGPQVVEELLKWITRVGIPRDIVTDQGSNFMSGVLRSLCGMLWIRHLRTMVYHPQTSGVVEKFNQTLKNMLWWCVQTDP